MSDKTENTTNLNDLTLGEILNRVKSHEEIVGPLQQNIAEIEQSIKDQVSKLEEALEEAERLKAQITKNTKRLERSRQELKDYEQQRTGLAELMTVLTKAGFKPLED